MTSLGEVYGRDARRETSTGRLYAGGVLFSVGVVLVLAGIVVATTGVLRGDGTTLFEVREYAGILAGIGVPAVFLGILTVLPADRHTRLAAGVGAGIAALGVGLFVHAYPCQWSGAHCASTVSDLTLPTVGTYFLGALIAFWYLFVGIANFKRRNDPGGTARIEVTRKGETKVVEVDPRKKGTLGFGKRTPDGETPTQTAASGPSGSGTSGTGATIMDDGSSGGSAGVGGRTGPSGSSGRSRTTGGPGGSGRSRATRSSGGSARSGPSGPAGRTGGSGSTASAASDGGAAANDITSFDDDGAPRESVPGDPYCGNCRHFEYVRTERGMQPYCGRHDEEMDDMDACEEWTPRSERSFGT